jgi:hypothetical protein|tara:strand:- start:226 stop:450 length:225 start_codon:yes stop_codon:yes gene_type:complete
MAKVDANKALNVGKDGYQKGGITIATPSQNLELDPRSKTAADGIQRNYIPTGDNVEVKGTKRMLKSKSKTATWY